MFKKGLLTYALDSNNRLVGVDEVPNGRACECRCPVCDAKLLAKNQGAERIHHFAHDFNESCGAAYETMLHLLAKSKIQEAFLTRDVFNIKYEYRSYCPNDKTCEFVKYGDCYVSELRTYNLKEWYDSCEQEVQYDSIRRRSDLKIYSSCNPDREPVYIEIYVTHASDDYKLHNGGKIIEAKIDSEADIDAIVENGFVQSKASPIGEAEIVKQTPYIAFYGFLSEDNRGTTISRSIHISRYILHKSGKSIFLPDNAATCRKISKSRSGSLMEICFYKQDRFDVYEMAKYIGYKTYGIRNCSYCQQYVDNYNGCGKLCRLYKRLGISNLEHNTERAKDCPYFDLREREMNEALSKFDSLPSSEYIIFKTESK